jgi:hypothetical protein
LRRKGALVGLDQLAERVGQYRDDLLPALLG